MKSRKKYYVFFILKKKTKFVHRILLDLQPNQTIKFKNTNSLDLRRENLEVITYQKNKPCKKSGCLRTDYYANGFCSVHYKCSRGDTRKYYSTVRGKKKKAELDLKFNNTHKSGYGVLKRICKQKNKILSLTLEEYEALKNKGCSDCGKQLSGRSCGLKLINKKDNFTLSNVVPICGVCSLKNPVSEFDFIKYSMAKLRRSWNKNPNALLAIQKSKDVNGKCLCVKCNNRFSQSEINVDHIIPVISTVDGFISLDDFAKKLLCSCENLQIICKPCHRIKSNSEIQERKKNNALRKSKIARKKITGL